MLAPINVENLNDRRSDLEDNETRIADRNEHDLIPPMTVKKMLLLAKLLGMLLFVLLFFQKLSVVGLEKGFTHLDATFNISCGMLMPKCSTECFELHHNSTTLDIEDIRRTRTWWNNACEQQWEDSQIIVFFGSLFGFISLSIYADKFGRRLAFITACVVEVISALCAIAFQSHWWGLALFRFITAIPVFGMKPISIVFLMEITTIKWRLFVLALYLLPFNLEDLILTGFESYGPRQQYLVLTMIVQPIICLIAFKCFVRESPQWLSAVSHGRDEIPTVAKNCIIPPNIEDATIEVKTIVSHAVKQPVPEAGRHVTTCSYTMSKVNFWDVRRFQCMVQKIGLFYLICIVGFFTFFGFPQYIRYGGDAKIIDNLIVASCQLFGYGYICCMYGVRDFDRKGTLIMGNVVATISIFIMMFFKDNESLCITLFSCIGLISTSMSHLILHFYAFELFPTVIRSTGIGIMLTISVITSTGSPHVVKLSSTHYLVPLVIFLVVLLFGYIFIYFIPETRGKRCLRTLEDGNAFCKQQTNTRTGLTQ